MRPENRVLKATIAAKTEALKQADEEMERAASRLTEYSRDMDEVLASFRRWGDRPDKDRGWFLLARVSGAVPLGPLARTRRVYTIRAIRSFWFLCEFVDFQLLEH